MLVKIPIVSTARELEVALMKSGYYPGHPLAGEGDKGGVDKSL